MRKTLWLIVAMAAVAGCGDQAQPPAPKGADNPNAQVNAIKSKLDKMSPTERADYIKSHPDEFQKLGGL